MEIKEAVNIAQRMVNLNNEMTGVKNERLEAIQTLIDHATHPQREALDEEKVYQVLKEWQYDSDEEFVRGQAKAICAKFGATSLLCKHKWSHPTTGYGYQVCMNDGCNVERFYPSLEDLLSALPGKECPVVHISIKEQYYCSHCERAAGYNEAIAALKERFK